MPDLDARDNRTSSKRRARGPDVAVNPPPAAAAVAGRARAGRADPVDAPAAPPPDSIAASEPDYSQAQPPRARRPH